MLSGLIDLFFYFLLPIGPAIYVLARYNYERQGILKKNKVSLDSMMLALVWTLLMLLLVMFWHLQRGERVKSVCKAFESHLSHQRPTIDQQNDMREEDWWLDCHPEDAPDPPSTRD